MINEEKFTKVKEKLAIRKAVKNIQSILWNPKRVLSWLYWLTVFVILPCINASIEPTTTTFVRSFVMSVVGIVIANVTLIAITYVFYTKQIEELDR